MKVEIYKNKNNPSFGIKLIHLEPYFKKTLLNFHQHKLNEKVSLLCRRISKYSIELINTKLFILFEHFFIYSYIKLIQKATEPIN